MSQSVYAEFLRAVHIVVPDDWDADQIEKALVSKANEQTKMELTVSGWDILGRTITPSNDVPNWNSWEDFRKETVEPVEIKEESVLMKMVKQKIEERGAAGICDVADELYKLAQNAEEAES